MTAMNRRLGRRGAHLVTIIAIIGLIGAACTPPPPPLPPSDDTVLVASQIPGGSANYVDMPVPIEPGESYLTISADEVRVRLPNPAYGANGHDHWSLRCVAPITWNGTDTYSCAATGLFRQASGTGFALAGGPGLIHGYATAGSLTIIPAGGADRATYTGTTEYYGSSRATIFGGYDPFVDAGRVGQTWAEVLEVEDSEGYFLPSPGQDSVLFDRPDPAGNGRLHEFFDLQPLSVPLPPPEPPDLIPPIEVTYRGEVEVGATDVSAAATGPFADPPFWVDELGCDGPQTANPDGSLSCPASGRRAERDPFAGSPSGSTDHYDAVGTLTTSAGSTPASAIFEGTLTYVRTRLTDGSDWVNPELAGSVEPRYLQFQDGRPTDEPYPFPD